ncbi:helix-turn-helix domain-containing protein [Companilactobacillus alimentarius]|uniref:helix-turn-helix domain-containing protein n=1 Tax=Companilactobacillus alimentarius TaxID=1602 RepID=UPI0009F8DCBC|nr:helix-turn-helix transcriptional regulator [Companilactobacillus alimentarius]
MGVLFLFLGSIIYNKRREMNLTQIELADDICTQNTISKIEKHNTAPTVNILIKICLKLNLSLNDVFSDFSSRDSVEKESALDKIEHDALSFKLNEIDQKMSSLQGKLNNNDMKQYELIIGIVEYQKNNIDESLFTLDKVLQLTKSANDDIYTLLAYLFKGLGYLKQSHIDRAQYYFQMISDSFEEKLEIPNANELEVLFLCKTLAKSFIDMKLYQKAYRFSHCGLNYAQRNHTSYFLDELNYSAACAVKNDPDKKDQYDDYYNLAYYLAKFNQNKNLLKEINH